MNQLTPQAIDKIKELEGCSLTPYQDIGGVWTIGYGHTGRNGIKPLPDEIKNIESITQDQANDILLKDLSVFENTVTNAVSVPINDNQYSSLVSFAFNVGGNAFRKSTLLKELNNENYDKIPSELLRWIYTNGKVVKGLKARRLIESAIWLTDLIETNNGTKNTNIPKAGGICPKIMALINTILGGGAIFTQNPIIMTVAFILMGSAYTICKIKNKE